MHYKNGRLSKIGDPVIGRTYNRHGTQVGVLIGITPGQASCNCRVGIVESKHPDNASTGTTGQVHYEPDLGNILLCVTVDYSACNELLHAEDAVSAEKESSIPEPA